MILTHHAQRLRYVLVGITLGMAVILPGTAADYPTTVLSFSPVAYWRLDEAVASPPLNVISNSGSIGRAGDGYAVLDVTNGEPGIVGASIRLNNAGSTITYCGSKVDVPYNAAINRSFPFTIEFWAKPNSLPVSDTTGVCPLTSLNNNWYGGANRSGWLFYCNVTGRWNFRLGLTSGYAANVLGSSHNAAVNSWQHMVATYDGLTVNLYADGVLIGSQSSDASVTGWLPNPQTALRMGGTEITGDLSDAPSPNVNGAIFGNSGNRGWDGWIDEVAIYPTVLSAATIAAHHDAATTNAAGYDAQILASNPVGYWNMDQPAVIPPAPGSLPTLNNIGTLGASADATNQWGSLTAQSGSGYAGLGATNKAIFFDGENGSIAINDAPGLHFTGNITLMAWIKPTVQDFYRDIIAHGYDANYAETFLRITRGVGGTGAGDGNYYEIGATDDTTFYDSVLVPIAPGDIGNWVFLAGTFDGANWNLYRNGTLIGSVAASSGDTGALDVAMPWSIGSRSDPYASPDTIFAATGLRFGGWIDEPAIFTTALTAAQINTIYNAAQVSPVIYLAVQPPSGPVYTGSALSLSVWAEGSPVLNYAWYHDGNLIAGQSATNLTVTGLTTNSSGLYSVVVTNAYGSVTSSVPITVVTSPPLITQQPVSETRFASGNFSFSVGADGSLPLSYLWSVGGSAISGATQSVYTAVAQTSGNYTCTITNAYGATNSAAATLTVLPEPSGYATVVLGDTPFSYWRLGETNGSVAHDYVSGNDGNYYGVTLGLPGYSVIDPDTAAGFGGVNIYVGDISGTAVDFSGHTNFSIEAWVKGPAGQPDESTIIAKGRGSSGTDGSEQFSLDVLSGNFRFFTRGGNNVTYEADATVGPDGNWQHLVGVYDDADSIINIYVNGQLSGTGLTRPSGVRTSSDSVGIGSKHLGTDPNYDGDFTGAIDEVAVYHYALTDLQVSNHYAAAYGPSLPPSIQIQPVSATNYVSLPVVLSVGAAGTVPLSYQWNKGVPPVPIPGATNATYTNLALAFGDAGTYSVIITNVNGVTNSANITLTVLSPPTSTPTIPGLVLHLPFDGSLTDSTGRGNNGTAIHISGTSSNVSSASFVAGMLGQALQYSTDTNGPNNTYVTLGVRPDLQFSNNVSFSVAYWIQAPVNYAGGDLPFVSTAIGSTFNFGLVLAYTYGYGSGAWPGGWAFSIFDASGAGVGGRGAVGSINDGNWHHLVHIFDRQNGVSTFLDGVAVSFQRQFGTSFQASGDIDTGNPFTIGQDPTGVYGETGSGTIDDLGVWRRALTPLEAASIYIAAVSNQLSYVNGNYTIAVSASPSAAGTVSGGGTFPSESSQTVKATANSGFAFVSWTQNGNVVSSSPSYTFTLTGDTSLVANFTAAIPTISIGKSGSSWQITYTGVLRSSATANGTYNLVNGATSPYTIPAGTGTQFYRASSN